MPRYGNNIYKRADGRFEGRYIRSRTEGKARYGYIYGNTYHEVKAKLEVAKSKPAEISSSQVTITKYLMSWVEQIKPNVKESTYVLYLRHIHNHVIPKIGNIKLQSLSRERVNKMITNLSNLAPKTIHTIFIILRSALADAVSKKLIAVNPCTGVKLPKMTQKIVEVFTPEQQALLEAHCDIGVLVSLYTGIRIGELLALDWGDIDLHGGMLHIRKTIQRIADTERRGNKTKIIITPPKTQSSQRSIPLPQFLVEKLKPLKRAPNMPLVSMKDKRMEVRTYQYRFEKLLQSLNLPPRSFHSLRHTFSTRALELGFDIKTLSECLGHQSPTTTLKTYSHCMMEHKQAQMNLFEKLQNI